MGKGTDGFAELFHQSLLAFLGTVSLVFIKHLAEIAIVRDGIVLVVVMGKESHRSLITDLADIGGGNISRI